MLQYDQAIEEKKSTSDQLALLQKSLDCDVNNIASYERLVRQYRSKNEGDSAEIQKMLFGAIAEGKALALAHFALSNLYFIDGDTKQADWHMQQSYKQDTKFAVIGNNYAWTLAHRDPPELDQAYEIIHSVIEQAPNDARFRDTYATILMKQGKTEEAIQEFEKALKGLTIRQSVHQNLAVLYRKLGKDAIAAEHEKLAVTESKQ